LSHNAINDIIEDADGNLWIASWGGLNMFDRSKEKFIRFKSDTTSSVGISTRSINKLFIDSEENLWIGTDGGGLNMYDKKNKKFIYYFHDEANPASLVMNRIKDIVEDEQHRLWIATDGGLDMFDKKLKTFTHFKHDRKKKGSLCADVCWDLFIDRHHQMCIGTEGGGLDMFDTQKNEFIHFKDQLIKNNSQAANVIRTISEDDDGNLWIGIENGGLSIYNIQNKTFDSYFQDEIDNVGLNNNSIWSLYKDKRGNMWVGTFSTGINFVNRDANKFTHYRKTSSPFSLNNNYILSLFEDSKRNLWVGTDGGGVNLFDAKAGTFSHYLHQANNPNSISANFVLKIFEDSRGEIWIGTWGGGVTVFNKEKNTFKHFKYDPADPKGLPSPNVWTICEDADKNVWVGTYNGNGAAQYDRKNNNFIQYTNNPADPSSLAHNVINIIFNDKEGKLWIGTNGAGLDLFNKSTKNFTHFPYIEKKNSLSNNDIYCITEDSTGNLWIGTKVGLNYMDRKTGHITNYFVKDGLPSNTITGLLIDGKGNLWISTFNGLSRFDPVNKIFKNFTVNDGLQSNEFKMNCSFKSKTGRMYFGGINGFNGFDPDSIKEELFDPSLVFTNFQIFNKQIPISNGNDKSPLKTTITDTRKIVLSYKQSVFSFEFASLNYAASDKKQYSYMLEGFDDDWNNVGTQHSATYTNLDPGEYTFKVRALNNEGEWSSTTAAIKVIITPPFWLTWWFKVIAIITLLGSAFAFIRFRINIIHDQKEKLETKVQEQTGQLSVLAKEEYKARQQAEQANIELERKNKELEQFAYVASHDMQEPLRTTSSFVELLQKQYQGKLDDKADKYLTFIAQSSERMKVLIKDLLDYSRIGRKKELVPVDCNLILKEVLDDLEVAIKESNANIKTGNLPVIKGYATEIKQLLQNLVINAVKFRKADIAPEIEIKAERNNGCWEFTCKDNGIGIDKEHQERIFIIFQRLHSRTEYEGSGIGLAHCKKIAEMHGGRIWLESEPQQGTTFYFTIPQKDN
ncbi:MAG: two-component regulator propeller domain-containing protein, partial [Chitinophagaceae bacterium]